MNFKDWIRDNVILISLAVLLGSMALVYYSATIAKTCINDCQAKIDDFKEKYVCAPTDTYYMTFYNLTTAKPLGD